MSTDNPKISLYVPQVVYDAFIKFRDERGLSMSQAGIVILAEYFGLQQTIQETTKGTTVGGVTLDAFQNIQSQLSELQHQFFLFQSNTELLDELERRLSIIEEKLYSLKETSEPLSDTNSELPLFKTFSTHLTEKLITKQLVSRFGVSSSTSITNQARKPEKEFIDWSRDKDPDGIAWKSFKENDVLYYSPVDDTPSELLSKLQDWLKENLGGSAF
jgi:hypothetical protein